MCRSAIFSDFHHDLRVVLTGGAVESVGFAALALTWHQTGMRRAAGTLGLAAALTVALAFFPADRGAITSIVGRVHAGLATAVFLLLNASFWLAATTVPEKWHRIRAAARVHAWVATIALVHLALVLVVRQVASNPWTEALGLWERALIVANMSWIGITAYRIRQ